jgi:hypothetical protein
VPLSPGEGDEREHQADHRGGGPLADVLPLVCGQARGALDPFPEVLGKRLSGLLTLDREGFAGRFAGVDSEPVAPRAPWEGPSSLPLTASPSKN